MAPENANIDIFLRLRPTKQNTSQLVLDANENKIEFVIPRDIAQGFVNNQREHYEFRFNGIMDMAAKQDEVLVKGVGCSMASCGSCPLGATPHVQVFERVARPVVSGALEGFNGTIFA